MDVLFHDCTTLAFDTEHEDAETDAAGQQTDRLLAKGFSKDGRHHRSQVMLALMVTSEGLPIGHDLFPGNTWEGHTLKAAIAALEQRFRIAKVTLVADAALLGKDNQALLQAHDLPCILGYRMKSAPASVKAALLDETGYRPGAGHGAQNEAETGRCKVIEHDGSRIIVTWLPARARKDAHRRDKAIEKIQKKIRRSARPASFSSRGYSRFLSFPGDGKVTLEAARWDGLHAILVHGADDLPPTEAVARSHQLREIEACFRTNKHDLKIRPVHHWTPRRVRAHIAICYIAFCCLQHLRKRLDMLGHPMSPARIRKALNALQVSILRRKGTSKQYAMPSPLTTEARRILKCGGLTWNEAPFPMPSEQRRNTTAPGC